MGSGLERAFKISWLIIKLNLMFHLFSLLGLLVLGIGPSAQMVSHLFQESKMDDKEVTFNRGFELWKFYFRRSNAQFWLFMGTSLFLIYNLYLSTQIQGIMWLMIDFLLIITLLVVFVTYQYLLVYEAYYDMPFLQILKLSFISVFLNFLGLVKIILGLVVISAVTWYMKGLLVFATFSLMIAWDVIATQKHREFIDGKLEESVK